MLKKGKIFIIAEAGVNHNGCLELAKKMIQTARDAGADAIKFQSFNAERLVAPEAGKAPYQMTNARDVESQGEMLKRYELSQDDHREIFETARTYNILALSTPFDEEHVDLLDQLGMSMFKVGSGEVTNIPFLRYLAKRRKPILLSTGMAVLEEIRRAVTSIVDAGNHNITLLQCVSSYPAPLDEANVRAMITLQQEFGTPVGFSDHTIGVEAGLAAAALGASVIEKHFTLDKRMEGPDHQASLDGQELGMFIHQIRKVEQSLGDGRKRIMPSEEENVKIVRRSLFTDVDILPGSVIQKGMVTCKRPASGIPPYELDNILGRKAVRFFRKGEMLDWSGIDGGAKK